MAKYFFLLIVGITTGLWINVNSKTFRTWQRFFCCEELRHDYQHRQSYPRQQVSSHRYSSQSGRDTLTGHYTFKQAKAHGSKYSLPSTKQAPLAHV
jgi:hypothetical protein